MSDYLLIRNVLPFKNKSASKELIDLLIGQDGLLEQVGSKIEFWKVGKRMQKSMKKQVMRVAASSRG